MRPWRLVAARRPGGYDRGPQRPDLDPSEPHRAIPGVHVEPAHTERHAEREVGTGRQTDIRQGRRARRDLTEERPHWPGPGQTGGRTGWNGRRPARYLGKERVRGGRLGGAETGTRPEVRGTSGRPVRLRVGPPHTR